MESPHQSRVKHIIYAKVNEIKQIPEDGPWYVHFEGSWESLCFGEHPGYTVGDTVKMTFEKQEVK